MISLYHDLSKNLDKINKEQDKIAENIKYTVDIRLKFINDAWQDLDLTKEEKKKIYEDYMDTSKAFQQYLIDKEKQLMKNKNRNEIYRLHII